MIFNAGSLVYQIFPQPDVPSGAYLVQGVYYHIWYKVFITLFGTRCLLPYLAQQVYYLI